MAYSSFLSMILGIGWLLSPESLVITGNTAGQMGWLSLPVLLVVTLIFMVCGRLLKSQQLPDTPKSNTHNLHTLTGTIPAISLRISSRFPLLVLAATALLVTSGYTFNEVFLYWFPTFGFSFLLLFILSLLQLFPDKIIYRTQICFVCIAASGLLILGVYGTASAGCTLPKMFHQPSHFSPVASATLLLLFAGITLPVKVQPPPFLIPLAGLVIFSLWMLASLAFVNPERLASSTIPYMTAARKIMGAPGRQIMGMVIISGTCAAITTLMLNCKHMISEFTNSKKKTQRWVFPLLFAAITGILMATGLAGDAILEVLLRAALVLWLLHYTLCCCAVLFLIQKETGNIPLPGAFCTLLLLAGLCTLIISNPQRTEMLLCLGSMLAISGLFGTLWFFINKNILHMEKSV